MIQLIRRDISCFISGGALGFDMMAAQTILELKQIFRHIRLTMVVPYPEQNQAWSEIDKAIYRRILAEANEVVLTSDHYFRGCIQLRNRCLVDRSNICICYLIKSNSGTAYTVNYAEKKGLKIINLAR